MGEIIGVGHITLTDLNDVISSSTQPTNPTEGLLWFNQVDQRMYVYTGGAWKPASPEYQIEGINLIRFTNRRDYFSTAATFATIASEPQAENPLLYQYKATVNTANSSLSYLTLYNGDSFKTPAGRIEIGSGQEYTISIKIKGNRTGTDWRIRSFRVQTDAGTSWVFLQPSVTVENGTFSTGFKTVSITFDAGQLTGSSIVGFAVDVYGSDYRVGDSIIMKDLKLEKGKFSTTWTPNPEDVLDDINDHSESIESIIESIQSVAIDGNLNYDERKFLKNIISDMIGYRIGDSTALPSFGTLTRGDVWKTAKAAVAVGIPTTDATYTSLVNSYGNLITYLNGLTSPRPYDTSTSNKDKNTVVVRSTFETHWANYYSAIANLASKTADRGKQNLDETNQSVIDNKEEIDGLAIGTRNYYINGDFTIPLADVRPPFNTASGATNGIVDISTEKPPFQFAFYGKTTSSSTVGFQNKTLLLGSEVIEQLLDTDLMISFWVKMKGAAASSTTLTNLGRIYVYGTNTSGSTVAGTTYPVALADFPTDTSHTSLDTGWVLIKKKFRLTKPANVANGNYTSLAINMSATSFTGEIWLTGIQLVKGNRVGDWSNNPLDVQARFTKVEQKITNDSIISTISTSTNWVSLTGRVSAAESDIGGLETAVEAANQELTNVTSALTTTAIMNKVTSTTTWNSLANNASNALATANALNTRMTSAESKITSTAIVNTVIASSSWTTLASSVSSSANKIALVVSSDDKIKGEAIASSISQTPNAIKLIAENIDLTGKVTFEALTDSAKKKLIQSSTVKGMAKEYLNPFNVQRAPSSTSRYLSFNLGATPASSAGTYTIEMSIDSTTEKRNWNLKLYFTLSSSGVISNATYVNIGAGSITSITGRIRNNAVDILIEFPATSYRTLDVSIDKINVLTSSVATATALSDTLFSQLTYDWAANTSGVSNAVTFTGTNTYAEFSDVKSLTDNWKYQGTTTINGGVIQTGTIEASAIKTGTLEVGKNVLMGANAYIAWDKVNGVNKPNTTYLDSYGIYTGTLSANQIKTGNIDIMTNARIGQKLILSSGRDVGLYFGKNALTDTLRESDSSIRAVSTYSAGDTAATSSLYVRSGTGMLYLTGSEGIYLSGALGQKIKVDDLHDMSINETNTSSTAVKFGGSVNISTGRSLSGGTSANDLNYNAFNVTTGYFHSYGYHNATLGSNGNVVVEATRHVNINGYMNTNIYASSILNLQGSSQINLTSSTIDGVANGTGGMKLEATAGYARFHGRHVELKAVSGTGLKLITDKVQLHMYGASSDVAALRVYNGQNTSNYAPVYASSFINQSERQSKKNIKIYTPEDVSALESIYKTNIYEYHYNNQSDVERKKIGLIADEAPLVVLEEGQSGVDVYAMAAMMWKGLQEMIFKVQYLEDKLNNRIKGEDDNVTSESESGTNESGTGTDESAAS